MKWKENDDNTGKWTAEQGFEEIIEGTLPYETYPLDTPSPPNLGD